jgi:hypothetical protein
VATADFNNDGHLDLVTGNAGSNYVSVLLGSANGTFGPVIDSPSGYPAGFGPTSIAVGDFDDDGNLDLAAVNRFHSVVSVLFGNGDGGFEAPSGSGLDPRSTGQSVAVGDFNEDGLMDLVVASIDYSVQYYEEAHAAVLLSNGDRTFSLGEDVPIGVLGVSAPVVVTDFDGDDNQDVLVGFNSLEVQVLLGDGAGNLSASGYAANIWQHGGMAVGDVNGDGDADQVAADNFNVNVRLGNGDGGFELPYVPSSAAGDGIRAIALGDFDRDGVLDVATANYNGNDVSILRGNGNGTFAAPQHFAAGPGAYAVTVGDFNGDGWLDIATANINGDAATVLINDRTWVPVPLTVSVSDATAVTEGNAGTTNATFTVSLSKAHSVDVRVNYNTANGSAAAGSDYSANSGTVTILAGQTSQTFTVAVLGDRVAEPTETFAVNLSAPTNATIGDGQGFATILDDEPRVSINDVSATEGASNTSKLFTFTVSLTSAYDQAVTVNFATANGTAKASSDYQSKTGSVTFAPGETTKTITVAVTGDKQQESNETFFVNLSGATSAGITDGQGLGTILNDDGGGPKGRGNSFALAVDAAIDDWMFSMRKKRAR